MLSIFPSLLAYEQLSPFLIRITLALVLIYWAYQGLKSEQGIWKKVANVIEGLVGVLILLGLWTQVAALIAAVGLLVCLIGKIRNRAFLTDGVNYVLILFVLAVSLLFSGAGAFAFDLPL